MSTHVQTTSLVELTERAHRLATSGQRRILGITGSPGAGKTTASRAIAAALGPQLCALVPMDGFHLSNATLLAWERRDRKGAWDTFDASGFVHLLTRLRTGHEHVVHVPDFDRDIDEPIAAAIPVSSDVPLVIVEGSYLLTNRGDWSGVRRQLDESWYFELDDPTRQARLVARHVRHGMAQQQACDWAAGTDQANAEVVRAGRSTADHVWSLSNPVDPAAPPEQGAPAPTPATAPAT